MTEGSIVIEVQLTEPGSEHLAEHLRARLESAVVGEIADLSETERRGIRTTSRVLDAEGNGAET